MQLPAAASVPQTEPPDPVACKIKHGRKMEDVIGFLESVNRIVELKVTECKRCWEDYVKSFANYTSVIRINGKPLLPPVMNPVRREAMRACRLRLTSTATRHKSKRKDLMAKVEFAADDVGSLTGCHGAPPAARAAASVANGTTSREPCGHVSAAAVADAAPRQSAATIGRQRLGVTEGAERAALARSGARRSSSCGNLYQHSSPADAATAERAERADRVALLAPGRPVDGSELRCCLPAPPPVGVSVAAASRNRLAVRYMNAGAATAAVAAVRQPFFPPVSSLAVQSKASDGTASAPGGSCEVDGAGGQQRLLDRVALAASCDEGELDAAADVDPAASRGAGGACDGSSGVSGGAVGASAHRLPDAAQHAVDPGERREADGKAAGEDGDDLSAELRRRSHPAAAACRQLRSVENVDFADALVAVSHASGTATLTIDTNLPSHLRGSASATDTLASSGGSATTLGRDAELAASCCTSFGSDDRGGRGNKDADLAIVVGSSEGSSAPACDLPSAAAALSPPPKLLRSNSYTLKSPSPALLRAQLTTASKEPAAPDAGMTAAARSGETAGLGGDRRVSRGAEQRRSAQRRLAFVSEQQATGDQTAGVPDALSLAASPAAAAAAAAMAADDAVSASQRGSSVPHPDDENSVVGSGDCNGTSGCERPVFPRQQQQQQQPSSDSSPPLRSRRRRTSATSTADEDDGDDEEANAEARRGLVLLKSKFHDRLLTRLRGVPLLGADYRRPSTALPLSGSRMHDAAEAVQPPAARPSTATGVTGRCAVSPASGSTLAASESSVTSECSQWLALPETDICVVDPVGHADPVSDEGSSSRRRDSTTSHDGFSALAAYVKGYLTRRLFETEKVKFLMKTVQDCQQLLVNLNNQKYHITASKTPQSAAGMDAGLRERIAAQLTSALGQIHDLFFVAPVQKRMALLRQHRILEAERKLTALVRSRSAEARRQRLSTVAASRAAEKRNQERMPGARPKSTAMPRRSASPKKAPMLSLGRVTKTIHRRSPVRRSGDGLRKRPEAVEHANGN